MSGVLDTKASDATLVDNTAKNNSSTPSNSVTTGASASEQIGTNYNQLSSLLPPHLETDNITPASPFSASFDPASNLPNSTDSNAAELMTPPTLRSHSRPAGIVHHHPSFFRESTVSVSTLSLQQAQEQWNQIVSSSLAALASQFDEASRQVASEPLQAQVPSVPQTQTMGEGGTVPLNVPFHAIHAKLEGIEASQARFVQDLETVRLKLKGLADDNSSNGNGDLTTTPSWKAKEKMREAFAVEERFENADSVSVSGRVENLQRRTEGLESRMEVLEKSVEGIVETIKLDQARLYSRLHNATVALNKHAIKAPPMANGKPPANFPVTKGEFEHLTKERYEHILKSYDLPVKGDINAKREAVREFIGLTPPGK